MGAIADFLANTRSVDTTLPRDGVQRVVYRQLNAYLTAHGDIAVPSSMAEKDEVQSIAMHTGMVTGGTFALTINLRYFKAFTTAAIAFDATAATIRTAINTAATTAGVTGWVNGDIAVTGGDLNTAPVVLTFSGDSVDATNHALTTIDGALLTGGGAAGAISTTTNGQTQRTSWALLTGLGCLTGTLPLQGVVPTDLVKGTAANPFRPCQLMREALAQEAGIEDDNLDVRTAILAAVR